LAEKLDEGRVVEHKGRIDLVTDADKASEVAVVSFLRERFPSHAILAEESGASAGQKYRWFIDPLDGTTNYAHRVPHFAVSIAVEGPAGLLAGVIYDPMRKELFSATKGRGATLNGRPIRVTETEPLERSLLATGFPYDVRENPDPPLALFNRFIRLTRGVRRFGSAALDLAYVACGRYDGFFEYSLKPWDVAAGALIVTEAGGNMAQLDGGPLDLMNARVIAAGPKLMPAIVRECRSVLGLEPDPRG
jgi:myo-inositol-1(or 4)-monophosphatase